MKIDLKNAKEINEMWTPDINRKIACYLPLSDIISLVCVNKGWSRLIKDERFWRLKLEADYKENGGLEEYKKCFYRNVVKLQEKDVNILCGLANYKCVKFINTMQVYKVDKTFDNTYWEGVFGEMRSRCVDRVESVIAIVKVFVRNRDFPKSNMIFSDKHLEKGFKLDFGYTLDGVWIVENIVEYFNKNHKDYNLSDPKIKIVDNIRYFTAIGIVLVFCYTLVRNIYK